MPVTSAAMSERNLTPTSTACTSPASSVPGTAAGLQIAHGQLAGGAGPIVTVIPGPGASRLARSSAARTRRFAVPMAPGVQAKVQFSPPCACRQVVPPLVETSTAPITPPPASAAVPLTVTGTPLATVPPSSGNPIADKGGVTSPVAIAGVRFPCKVAGCTAISASKLTVNCCIRTSSGWFPRS